MAIGFVLTREVIALFLDRLDAARRLARQLSAYKGQQPLVLGIPRGAVPMARLIADQLQGELDVVLVHKLGAPGNPEFALGAVSEDGTVQVSPDVDAQTREDHIRREVQDQLALLRQRRRRYTPGRTALDPRGRLVIVVDDGSATGHTMATALQVLKKQQPRRLIAALGVAPPTVPPRLQQWADEVVCLETPARFFAVGQFFTHFEQVTDEQVIACLSEAAAPSPERARISP